MAPNVISPFKELHLCQSLLKSVYSLSKKSSKAPSHFSKFCLVFYVIFYISVIMLNKINLSIPA